MPCLTLHATVSVAPLYTLSFSLPASVEVVDGGGKLKGQGLSRTEWEQSHEANELLGSEANCSCLILQNSKCPSSGKTTRSQLKHKLYKPVLNSLVYGWNQRSTFATL